MNEQVITVNPRELIDSPLQYRSKLGDITDLTESARQKGIIQPVTVRPMQGVRETVYEAVFGHRRKAAAIAADLTEILAVVRDLSDDDVVEFAVIENNQRENPPPLDEAAGFSELVKRGRTVQQIAERIGRPVTYVAQRLKLLGLSKAIRTSLDEEKISIAVALLVARVPDAKLQDEALKDLEEAAFDHDKPMTADEVRKFLEERYLLRLDQAPFDITSAELVPKAGACTACPKRTGQQRELFPDVKSPDLCTDPVCHRGKLDALWQIRKKDAKNGGAAVIEGKKADAIGRYSTEFVKLSDTEWVGTKTKTVREILEKDMPPILLARGKDGIIHEVVPRSAVRKVLDKGKRKEESEARHKPSATAKADAAKEKAAMQRAERKRETEREVLAALVVAIVEAIEKAGAKAEAVAFDILVDELAERSYDGMNMVLERRTGQDGLSMAGQEKALRELVKGASPADLRGLLVELVLSGSIEYPHATDRKRIADACKALKVNVKAVTKRVLEAAKATKEQAPAEANGKAKPAKKKGGRK